MKKKGKRSPQTALREIRESGALYLLMIPSIIIFLLFTYYPMYGVVIAFKDFAPSKGIWGSEWVGFTNFKQFFSSYQFWPTIKNTLVISIYTVVVTFPLPIALALMCNQLHAKRFKKFFQVSTYLPHFISTVVMCGMIILFLSPSTGIVSKLVGLFGFQLPNLMGSAPAFPHIYVWTEVWQHLGWDSILYIATLSSVDPSLYEAATMDGAGKFKRMIHIDIPALLPTATVMFILRMGNVMSVGFEKVYLLQNTMNSGTSEIISTYVYKMGLLKNQYSLSGAIGLFNNIINLALLLLVNQIAKKLSDTSLI